jgi:hypothetical protein
VVSAYLDERKKSELKELDIRHVFEKPLQKKAFLKTMHTVIAGKKLR